MPLNPTYVSTTIEPATLGIVAMAKNGVPIYGANEGGGTNAVEPGAGASITDAQHWYGHAARSGDWHYHAPEVGNDAHLSETELYGYALDGFPIYGPLADDSGLDVCNGRNNPLTNEYQYHVRTKAQVDESLNFCPTSTSHSNTNWNYIVGCYHGDMGSVEVGSYTSMSLPADCVLDSNSSSGSLDESLEVDDSSDDSSSNSGPSGNRPGSSGIRTEFMMGLILPIIALLCY